MTTPPAVSIGTTIRFRKTMTVAEQAFFTGISGNLAPLSVDTRAARNAGFDNALIFELAMASLATTALSRIGGASWRIGAIALDFSQAVTIGATIEAIATVTDVASSIIQCEIRCVVDGAKDTDAVIAGTATLVPILA
jgi:3-hydroxybutyryl-CoA dehydratase